MADPHHVPELDGFDRLTVGLYRSAIVLAALLLVAAGVLLLLGRTDPLALVWVGLAGATGLAVQDMHLYDKRIRWVIGASAWVGVVLALLALALGGPPVLLHAGLGFLFVSLSGFAIKEQFCFRIPGLRLVPLLLAGSLIPLVLDQPPVAGVLLLVAGGIYLVLAVAKLRMPLHFDVGDKSRYQV